MCPSVYRQSELGRNITYNGDPPHLADPWPVVVDGSMLGCSVVPNRERQGAPPKTTGVFWENDVITQHSQKRITLIVGQPNNTSCEETIHKEHFAPAHWMSANHRVSSWWIRCHRSRQPLVVWPLSEAVAKAVGE